MAVLRNGSKCSHTTCMLRFFNVSRLTLNSNLIFEIGYRYQEQNSKPIYIPEFACHDAVEPWMHGE